MADDIGVAKRPLYQHLCQWGVVLLLIEEGLRKLKHVGCQIVITQQRDPLHSILPDSLIREFCIQQGYGFFRLHRSPVRQHLINLVDLNGPVPLHAAEEYREPLWVCLIVLSAFEQIPLHLVIDPTEWVAVQILLQLCEILVLDLHINQVLLITGVLGVGRQLIVFDALLIP